MYYSILFVKCIICGDWGLGIGDCPIPNPQSPIPIIKPFKVY